MNLYLIYQNEAAGYDTYDSAVVAAESARQAQETHPSGFSWGGYDDSWASSPDNVSVDLIGTAVPGIEAGIICASFNAG